MRTPSILLTFFLATLFFTIPCFAQNVSRFDPRLAELEDLIFRQKYDEVNERLRPFQEECGAAGTAFCHEVRLLKAAATFFSDGDNGQRLLDTVAADTGFQIPHWRAFSLYVSSQLATQLNDFGLAAEQLREARSLLKGMADSDDRLHIYVLSDLAMIGVYDAESGINSLREVTIADRIAKASGRTNLRIQATMVGAIVATTRGEVEKAKTGFLKAIALAEADSNEVAILGGLYHNLSVFLQRQGELEAALAAIRTAIEYERNYQPESLRFAIFMEASILKKMGRKTEVIDLVNASIRHYPAGNWYEADGFVYFRHINAANLGIAMQLYGIRAEVLAELGDTINALVDAYAHLDVRDYLRERVTNTDSRRYWSRQHSEDYDAAIRLLLASGRDWEALLFSERVRTTALFSEYSSHYEQVDTVLTRTDIEAYARDQNTALLVYHLGPTLSLRFTVMPDGRLRVDELPPPETSLEEQINAWRETIVASAFRRKSVRPVTEQVRLDSAFLAGGLKLAGYLLPKDLPEGKLLIVADGPLGYLPFAALPRDSAGLPLNYTTLPVLGQQHQITNAHGLLLQQVVTARRVEGFSVNCLAVAPTFASPNYLADNGVSELRGFKEDGPPAPLVHNVTEVQRIADLISGSITLLGTDAAKNSFLTNSPQARFLHLSTHAAIDASNPEQSYIVFQQTNDSLSVDDLLFYGELANESFQNEMVCLSACETSIGKLAPGEGVLSLGSAFVAAGVSTTVTSLWRVDDAGTEELMVNFYQLLAEGKARDEALTLAQQAVRANPDYAHPYYWAPMTLHGANGVVSFSNNGLHGRWYLMGLLSLVVLFFWRRG